MPSLVPHCTRCNHVRLCWNLLTAGQAEYICCARCTISCNEVQQHSAAPTWRTFEAMCSRASLGAKKINGHVMLGSVSCQLSGRMASSSWHCLMVAVTARKLATKRHSGWGFDWQVARINEVGRNVMRSSKDLEMGLWTHCWCRGRQQAGDWPHRGRQGAGHDHRPAPADSGAPDIRKGRLGGLLCWRGSRCGPSSPHVPSSSNV